MTKKVYIADNDPHLIELMADYLDDMGYEAYGSHELFDLILLDSISLPDIFLLNIQLWGDYNNEIICKYLKWNDVTQAIPVILFSTSRQSAQSALECYADGFIFIPFEINDLPALLEKLTSRRD
jgi:two-component system alkaline phosphatase synthesis response regulator PhoP